MNALPTKRRRMPDWRPAISFVFEHDSHVYTATLGFYDAALTHLGEVFLRMNKLDSALDNHANDAAILASLLLQHGVSPLDIRHSLKRHPNGQPAGPMGALFDVIVRDWAVG